MKLIERVKLLTYSVEINHGSSQEKKSNSPIRFLVQARGEESLKGIFEEQKWQ